MKIFACFTFIAVAVAFNAAGRVMVAHEFRLGEIASLAPFDNRPLDSVGSAIFPNAINGDDARVETFGVYASGSTAYLNLETGTNAGFYGADFSSFENDNFAIGIFARASRHFIGDIFSTGGPSVNGAFKLSLDSNGWAASAHGVSWIGSPRGTSGSFSPNEWVHLAIIRKQGQARFYINGISQGASYAGIPQINQGHLAVAPSATSYFQGHIDEARIVTFDDNDSIDLILRALMERPQNDRDQDGLDDSVETGTGLFVDVSDTGTNPDMADSDGDGISDGEEVIIYQTNPNELDSDSDGFSDLYEIRSGFDPKSDESYPDSRLEIMTAIEVRFSGAIGSVYSIEFSTNGRDWGVIEDGIVGEGVAISRLYSKQPYQQGFFRVRRGAQ